MSAKILAFEQLDEVVGQANHVKHGLSVAPV